MDKRDKKSVISRGRIAESGAKIKGRNDTKGESEGFVVTKREKEVG